MATHLSHSIVALICAVTFADCAEPELHPQFPTRTHAAGTDGTPPARARPDSPFVVGCIRRRQALLASTNGGPSPVVHGTLAVGLVSFNRVCGRCHPGGEADVGPRLIGIGRPEREIRRRVREGALIMSAIPPACLPDEDLEDVLLVLRDIGTVRREPVRGGGVQMNIGAPIELGAH